MKYVLIFAFLLGQAAAFAQAPVDARQRDIVFQRVNVIPMDREQVLENQTVIVRDGRIQSIAPAGKATFDKNALVIDGRGKYLLPGLAEMHAHVPPVDDLEPMKEVLTLFLANGVTTIRGMLGHPRHLELRSKVQAGEILGPYFYTTGPSFNGQTVKTPAEGAAKVREQKAAGYDYLKLHPGLTKENFVAVAQTAHEVGIPFVGHVSFDVGIWRAIDAGYSSIDHLDGFVEGLVPGIETLKEPETGLFGMYIADRAEMTQLPKLMNGLKSKNVWVVPTQALAERWFSPQAPDAFSKAPEMVYMSPQTRTNWVNSAKNLQTNPQYSAAKIEKLVQVRRQLIKACQQNGVGLLLGSDAPQVFNVPGFSAHQELQYLVAAGLTPYQALRTGTVNVATYLNKNDSGVIKAGNVSDLVLLGGNPLRDITQTQRVEGVMLGSQWLPKAYLQQELKKLEKL